MSKDPSAPPSLMEEAQAWETALRSSNPRVQEEFTRWISRSPENLQAYVAHLALEHELVEVDAAKSIDVDALLAASRNNVVPIGRGYRMSREPPRQGRLIAAALVVCSLLLTAFVWFGNERPGEQKWADYVTATGEQRRMRLADGSVVDLNTQGHIRVAYSRTAREVELVSGQALFTVHHDTSLPFRVRIGHTVVRDVGTQFEVYLHPDASTTVSVLEGSVELHPAAGSFAAGGSRYSSENLNAGRAVHIDENGAILERSGVNLTEAAAWRQHKVFFENASLDAIASEFNRYNTKQIHVVDSAAVSKRRYTATWDPFDPDTFVQYLQLDPTLRVHVDAAEIKITFNTDSTQHNQNH